MKTRNIQQKLKTRTKKNRGSLRQLSAALKTKLNTIDTDPKNEKCVICNSVKHKRTVEKFPISDKDRADKFLKAACCLLDDVYIRICDFQDIGSLFGSQLYCHKACINHYLIKYDRISKRTEMLTEDPRLGNKRGTKMLKMLVTDLLKVKALI